MNSNKNNKNPIGHLKMPLYEDSGVSMLKISPNKRKKSKYQKYTQNSRKINANYTSEVI